MFNWITKYKFSSVLIGALYGLLFRVLGGMDLISEFYSVFSITFIWVVPVMIGVIPIIFSNDEIFKSKKNHFLFPFLSVLIFFILAFATRLEDLFCILIISIPFILVAGLAGLLVGFIVNEQRKKKLKSLLLIPFILGPIESFIESPNTSFNVESKIIINANKALVWNHLIEVSFIESGEFEDGFFQNIGVPRPLESKLEIMDGVEYRIGYFTDELVLVESISKIDTLNFVEFEIHMDKSKLRDVPMDQHVLESGYFQFNTISYRLNSINSEKTELTLKCEYEIESKMNYYANFWAELVVKDFGDRLLDVLKRKIEP